jgi:hypothetical protein
MRRARIGAGVVAALFLLTPLLLSGVAGAADGSHAGTYKGWAQGTGKGGGKATSRVTIWVQDRGDTVRFTIRVDRIGLTFDYDGVGQWQGDDTVVVPVNIKKMGIRATGTITLERDGENWILSASGKGKVLTYEGTGEILAVRVATGVKVPGAVEQFTGLFDALSGPPAAEEAPPEATKGDELEPPEPPAQVEQVEPASALSAAEAAPPIPEDDRWVVAMVFIIVILAVTGLYIFI